MKEQIEVTKCDECDSIIENETAITIDAKDFCSVDCLIDFVKKDHNVICPHCRNGYEFIDGGYGDDDVICRKCMGKGMLQLPSKYIFCSEETIELIRHHTL